MEKIKPNRHTLLMKYPSSWWSQFWREGLVSGNGIIGANVYGGSKTETVMLCHKDLWSAGSPQELPDVSHLLEQTRAKMDKGEFLDASWTLANELTEQGYKTSLSKPFPLADLKSTITPKLGFSHYLRALNMKTGEVMSQWDDDDIFYKRSLFVSRADNVIVYKIEASKKAMEVKFDIDIHKGSQKPNYFTALDENKQTAAENEFLYYKSNSGNRDLGAVVKIIPQSGNLVTKSKSIAVSESDSVLVLVKLFADGDFEKQWAIGKEALNKLADNYDYLLKRHKDLHEKLYMSASLKLGKCKNTPNEELLLNAFDEASSNELIEKMWHVGRYLFISGTDEKGNPFPLYGLWGGDYNLMWSHNMANENTQMIYWHTNVGNLMNFNKALFNYHNSKIEDYKNNAKKLYGCNGIFLTAGTTPNISAPNQIVPVIMNWTGAGAWIAQHYYQHYLYTQDKEFLKETVIPFMIEIANFYEDFIKFDENGNIKIYPSVSPENTPINFMPPPELIKAHPMPTTINSTIDIALVKELFTNMLAINEEVHMFDDRKEKWEKILNSIPEYKANADGAMREWQPDIYEDNYAHRHLSHIYPVFPGYEINSENNPEVFKACEKAVELRKIDSQTGWSLAHMACIYARFGRGNDAMNCLNNMAKASLLRNLITLHNDWRNMNISLSMDSAPVQMDANMGYVNAVQEMLIYSSPSLVKLLPALPSNFSKGKAENFRFCGGTVNFKWNISKNIFNAVFNADKEMTFEIKLPVQFKDYKFETTGEILNSTENKIKIHLKAGEALKINS